MVLWFVVVFFLFYFFLNHLFCPKEEISLEHKNYLKTPSISNRSKQIRNILYCHIPLLGGVPKNCMNLRK